MPAAATTRFALDYRPEGRRLTLKERAARLEPEHLPPHFAEAGLAYLCPVADEVAPELVRRVSGCGDQRRSPGLVPGLGSGGHRHDAALA